MTALAPLLLLLSVAAANPPDADDVAAFLEQATLADLAAAPLQEWIDGLPPGTETLALRRRIAAHCYGATFNNEIANTPQLNTCHAIAPLDPVPLPSQVLPAITRLAEPSGRPNPIIPGNHGITLWTTLTSLLSLLLLLAATRDGRAPSPRWQLLAGGALTTLCVLPVLPEPMVHDAPLLRHAYATQNVFDDWNHPFLSYLLLRPVALSTTDPVLLRLPYLLWVTAVGVLTGAVASRWAGRLAAGVAMVGFALAAPARQGVYELADWDLSAALLLIALLALSPGRSTVAGEPPRPPRWAAAIAFAVLATTASWLALPATLLLCAVILARYALGREGFGTLLIAACTAGPLLRFGSRVFREGQGPLGPPVPWSTFSSELMSASGLDQGPLVGLLAVVGAVSLLRNRRDAGLLWALASLTAITAALFAAWRFSHVNGGYYIQLVSPLVWALMGAGGATAIPKAPGPVSAICVAALFAFGHVPWMTVQPASAPAGTDAYLTAIQTAATQDLPIYVNDRSSLEVVTFHHNRARSADGRRGEELQLSVLKDASCALPPVEHILLLSHGYNLYQRCLTQAAPRCRPLPSPNSARQRDIPILIGLHCLATPAQDDPNHADHDLSEPR